MIAASLDTASEVAGVALSDGDTLIGEVTWRTRQNHSRELLPALDWLLTSRGLTKTSLEAVFVCLGPGSYAGLRVGLSTGKTLAFALDIPIAGIGRLAADADPHAIVDGPTVYAIHAAGRAELAWAAFRRIDRRLLEVLAPRLSRGEELLATVKPGDIACGEAPAPLTEELRHRGVLLAPGVHARVIAVARLGSEKLERGEVDAADSLVPMYLREPAIGPQPA